MKKNEYFKNLGHDPFGVDDFHVMRFSREHIETALHGEAPRVIITSSATGGGGRIVDYFENGIQRDDYIFVICGWVNPQSPTSKLLEANVGEVVEFPKQRYKKHCKTYHLLGFSSHGYYDEMYSFVTQYPNCSTIILNHGDMSAKEDVRGKLKEESMVVAKNIYIPNLYDAFEFSKDESRALNLDETYCEFEAVLNSEVLFDEQNDETFSFDSDDSKYQLLK